MPGATGAGTHTRGTRISGKEVRCRVTGEGAPKQDGTVLAAVAAIEGIEAETPELEAGLEDMLAVGDGDSVVKLDYCIGEVLVNDTAADVGERAGSGAVAVPPPKPSNSRPGPVLLVFAMPICVPSLPILGKSGAGQEVIQDAPKRASFKILGLKVWVHDPTVLWIGTRVEVLPKWQRVAGRVVLISLRITAAETVALVISQSILASPCLVLIGCPGLVDCVVDGLAVDRGRIDLEANRAAATGFNCDIGI